MACQENSQRYFVRTEGLFLVRCNSVETFDEEGQSRTLVVFEIVRPIRFLNDSGEASNGYEGVNAFDLPVGFCPSGPLELTEHPSGSIALQARDYSVAAPLHGAVLVFVRLHDAGADAQSLVERVFSLTETSGEGGIQPLFRNL
jgi:hypothetical protein